MQFSRDNLFLYETPSCATSPPSGDGAHGDTTIQMYWKLYDFSYRYYVNISGWGCHRAGAYQHAPRSFRVLNVFSGTENVKKK